MTENQNNMTPETLRINLFDLFQNFKARLITPEYYEKQVESLLSAYGSQQFTAGVEAGKREQWYYDQNDIIRIVHFAWNVGLDKKERSLAMDYAQALGQSKWIPVEERLPETELENENRGCPEFPHFGATYPDATCIDGYLWDLDSGDRENGLSIGGDDPCPFCNLEAYIEWCWDEEQGYDQRKKILEYVEKLNQRYGYSSPPNPDKGGKENIQE